MKDLSGVAILTVLMLAILALPTAAQDDPAPRFLPYTFVAPGGVSNGGATLQLGGGFDALLAGGVGVSIEGGFLGPIPDGFDYGIGVISANGVYHFGRPQRHRAVPFVTGGYSLGFRSSTINAVNFGAGLNFWLSDRTAVRVELRDHLPVIDGGVRDEHLWGVRMGFSWAR